RIRQPIGTDDLEPEPRSILVPCSELQWTRIALLPEQRPVPGLGRGKILGVDELGKALSQDVLRGETADAEAGRAHVTEAPGRVKKRDAVGAVLDKSAEAPFAGLDCLPGPIALRDVR